MTVPLIGNGHAATAHPPIVLWAATALKRAVDLRRANQMPAPLGLIPGGMSSDERWCLAVAQQLFLTEQQFVRDGEPVPFLKTNLLEVMGSVILWDLLKRRVLAWLSGQVGPDLPGQRQPDDFETAVKRETLRLLAEQRSAAQLAVFDAVKEIAGEGFAPQVAAKVSEALIPSAPGAVGLHTSSQVSTTQG